MSNPLTERPDRRKIAAEVNALGKKDLLGKRPPHEDPTLLKINSIKVATALFQPRDSLINEWASNDHVSQMAENLMRDSSKQRMLEPMTVMAFGSQWYLIDGHHRLRAYREAGYEVVAVKAVHSDAKGVERVKVGIKEAVKANSRDKLAMTREDKSNAAWRLVVDGSGLSAREIEELTQVSERTIHSMRKVARTLIALGRDKGGLGGDSDMLSYPWRTARMLAEGKSFEQVEKDQRVEREALLLAKKLKKHFRETLIRFPEVTKRALAIYDPRLPAALGVGLEEPEVPNPLRDYAAEEAQSLTDEELEGKRKTT